ncbi:MULTISPECIES: HAD family hydrolase [Flavobacterium]|uniref:HAD family hydrolase n=1 Tax=Flavobacterium TaxID=237 RepID=UPI001FCC4727|nr:MULTISPECIES: HAD family hydrolase [Flavobacterium]UOK41243.1 haloacid dehalogenase-like hydrolase [Flavobacterium enshiense]
MKTLALFDFDHTLYRKDSLLEFTKFSKGTLNYYLGLLTLFPILAGFKLGFISNEKAKEKFFAYFFSGMSYPDFRHSAKIFAQTKIVKDLNKTYFESLKHHHDNLDDIYIVTASFPEWIQPWSQMYGIEVIGTKPATHSGILTGNFSTKNCYGPQKVIRIAERLNLADFDKIYVYGNGTGDKEMLTLERR